MFEEPQRKGSTLKFGGVAERLGKSLQSSPPWFNSMRRLDIKAHKARELERSYLWRI